METKSNHSLYNPEKAFWKEFFFTILAFSAFFLLVSLIVLAMIGLGIVLPQPMTEADIITLEKIKAHYYIPFAWNFLFGWLIMLNVVFAFNCLEQYVLAPVMGLATIFISAYSALKFGGALYGWIASTAMLLTVIISLGVFFKGYQDYWIFNKKSGL